MLLDYLVFTLYATMKYRPSCPGYDTILPEYKTVTLCYVPRVVKTDITCITLTGEQSEKTRESIFCSE